jgi:ABC-type Fe3+ transport system substrate-binding protein
MEATMSRLVRHLPFSLFLAVLLIGACAPGPSAGGSAASAPAAQSGSPSQPAAAGGSVPAWQAEWDRTVAAARQEGKVVVYGPSGDLIRRNMTEAFRKAFPDIALEWTGGRATDEAAKIEAERRAGIYSVDVFLGGSTTALVSMRPIGAMDPVKPLLLLPEVTDPANWRNNQLEFSDKDETNLVFVNIPSTTVAFNKSQVQAEDVDEVHELLDPKWAGRIAINNPIPAGAGNIAGRFFYHVLGPERGAEYLRTLRAQAGAVDRDERRQVEWVVRNRFPVLVGASDVTLHQLREQGVEVGQINQFKEHGGAVTASAGTIIPMNRAPNPNAAKVFINWVLTRDGQTAWSTALNQPSLRLDVPTDHIRAESVPRPDGKYWRSYFEDFVETPPALSTLFQELFTN